MQTRTHSIIIATILLSIFGVRVIAQSTLYIEDFQIFGIKGNGVYGTENSKTDSTIISKPKSYFFNSKLELDTIRFNIQGSESDRVSSCDIDRKFFCGDS